MRFFNKEHEKNYHEVMVKMRSKDEYHTSVAYLLTLDAVCYKHINQLFDFADGCIKPDALNKEWQTGTSKQTTRLAFNLWNGYKDSLTTPDNLFCSDYAVYYWQAISLRFPWQCVIDTGTD